MTSTVCDEIWFVSSWPAFLGSSITVRSRYVCHARYSRYRFIRERVRHRLLDEELVSLLPARVSAPVVKAM